MWEYAWLGGAPSIHSHCRIAKSVPSTQACTPLLGHACTQPPSMRLHSQLPRQRCTRSCNAASPSPRRVAVAAGPQPRSRAVLLGALTPACSRADSNARGRSCLDGRLQPSLSSGGMAFRAAALQQRRQRLRQRLICASLEAGGDGSLVPLGLDFLTFLATTVLVIPLFKSVKASPVLGCGQQCARTACMVTSMTTPGFRADSACAAHAGFCFQAWSSVNSGAP